jgi:multicomponent Na+:H+ antiporter subunit B
MEDNALLRVIAKLLIPLILLFALYVQFHGEYGPGGGFQAGVIFAAGIVLYALVFGLRAARAAVPVAVVRVCLALGVLLYVGTGVACMLAGGNFLDYDVLAHHAKHGQHIGIILIELGVGLTVFGAVTGIFYVFAGYGHARAVRG